MPCRAGEKRDRTEIRQALRLAFVAAVWVFVCHLPSTWAAAPGVSKAAPGAFEASSCYTLQTKCRVTEDGKADVLCERPAFAAALLSCVDLWEAEGVCAENLSASRDLYSVDLEAWTAELARLEQERSRARLQGWVWGIVGVIGWGVAAGLFIWGAAK